MIHDGRSANGRFAPGNPGGPGNPLAKRVATIRKRMMDAVTDEQIDRMVAKLVELAEGGDLQAIREVFDRLVGRPINTIIAAPPETENDLLDDEQRQRLADVAMQMGLGSEFSQLLRHGTAAQLQQAIDNPDQPIHFQNN